MSFLPPDGAPPELTMTRVSGGATARLIALAVAGVLVAVVGFTVVNRPAPPVVPSPSAPWVAVVSTPTASPSPNVDFGDLTFQVNPRPVPYQFVATATTGGGQVPVALEQRVPGVYQGSMVLDASQTGTSLAVGVRRQWGELGVQVFASFVSANVDLDPLLRSHGRKVTLLIDVVPLAAPSLDSPYSSGYTLTIRGRRSGSQLTIFFELVYPARS